MTIKHQYSSLYLNHWPSLYQNVPKPADSHTTRPALSVGRAPCARQAQLVRSSCEGCFGYIMSTVNYRELQRVAVAQFDVQYGAIIIQHIQCMSMCYMFICSCLVWLITPIINDAQSCSIMWYAPSSYKLSQTWYSQLMPIVQHSWHYHHHASVCVHSSNHFLLDWQFARNMAMYNI